MNDYLASYRKHYSHPPLLFWSKFQSLYDFLFMPWQYGSPSAKPLSPKDATFVASALKDLVQYIGSDDAKNRQKLLRNLGILQRIIAILRLYKKAPDDRCISA